MTMPILRPTVAEVDLKKMARNLHKVRERVGNVKILTLLKANAYGHGAVPVGLYLQENSLCDFFGVASVEEGLALREAGVTLPVLVLGSIYPFEAFEYAIKNDLAITIASQAAASAVCEIAAKVGKKALCHVKQDTGMGRIGTRRANVFGVIETLAKNPNVILDGLYTHLSSADTDPVFTEEQVGYFRDTLTNVKLHGIHINHVHMAASPGVAARTDIYFDMVRPGHAAFGLDEGYEPVLSFKTRVVYVKDVPAGSSISYGRSFIAQKAMKVATLPVGYGDGYLRAFSNKAEVLIKGKRRRVLGNVTMDMMMVDITDAPEVSVGDEAVLAGRQGDEEITWAELAQKAGTIDYELCTLLMPRVPRIYKK
ncbi:MAG: alanine racemase [Elusimicrobia bacterium]|nr:alanine racemase [Elusimicrobiota bacterium]MDD7578578.1 alanine racemase [Elusimicrobiota bacterium]MDY6039454.1 alanine racemase [Elusimicrobiaceae bacterium]